MTKVSKLQELFDIAAKNIVRMFEAQGEILPMWHVIRGNGEHTIIATPWSNEDEKENTIEVLREFFRKHKVKRLVFVAEAWTVTTGTWDGTQPSTHPDRRETVSLMAEDRDGSNLHGWYYILRPEHGPPKLSPLHMSNATESAGRMVGLLD